MRRILWLIPTLIGLLLLGHVAMAQDAATAAPPAPASGAAAPVPATAEAAPPTGVPKNVSMLTLQEMITHGGVFLWVIMALGFVALVLSLYFMLTLSVRREAPRALIKRAHAQIAEGDFRAAYQMCLDRDEYLANVLRAGLKLAGHDRYVVQEAMESEGERGATALWQKISWLNSIATIAPLLGLLGTVWGMMQAFRSIAFDDAQARGMAMAYAVSEAMITTAAGLLLAIPCMMIYYLLRARVIRIVAEVEAQASEVVEMMAEAPASPGPAPRGRPELVVREGRR